MRTARRGVAAFGPEAAAWAKRLPPDLDAVAIDMSALNEGYAEVLSRRTAGGTFFVATLVPDSRTELAQGVAMALASHGYDDRRTLFDQLSTGQLLVNDRPVRELSIFDEPALAVLRDLHVLSDAVLARSSFEYERQAALIGRRRRHVAFLAPLVREFPQAPSARGGALIVWAPSLPWERVTLLATAAEELRVPVVVVAATLPPHPMPARYVRYDEGRDALGQAIAVVDATPYDPGVALSLLALGVPMAAASTTGVQSYADGIAIYDPWDWRSAQAACVNILGSAPARPRGSGCDLDAARAVLAAAAPPAVADQPLVSIVVPTYNRRDALENVLETIAAQTYENVECIVVNDAGQSVDDVVGKFPKARLIVLETNSNDNGVTPANVGWKHARGKYLGVVADDDVLYPDHVARLVAMLETNAAGVAHGNNGFRFLERVESDEEGMVFNATAFRTSGFNASLGPTHVDPHSLLVMARINLQSVLFRREYLESLGGGLSQEYWMMSDHEFLMRVSQQSDILHADHVTTEWRVHDANHRLGRVPEGWQVGFVKMWDRFPYPDRPSLKKERDELYLTITGKIPKPAHMRCEPNVRFAAGTFARPQGASA